MKPGNIFVTFFCLFGMNAIASDIKDISVLTDIQKKAINSLIIYL
jgi:hypothetical protein